MRPGRACASAWQQESRCGCVRGWQADTRESPRPVSLRPDKTNVPARRQPGGKALALRPPPDWARPTHPGEGSLLRPAPGLHVNLIPKHRHAQIMFDHRSGKPVAQSRAHLTCTITAASSWRTTAGCRTPAVVTELTESLARPGGGHPLTWVRVPGVSEWQAGFSFFLGGRRQQL